MKIRKIAQSRLSSKGNGNCKPHPQKELLWQGDVELWCKFGPMYRPSLFVLQEHSRGICWILETTLGQPGCSQPGCNAITVRFTWKDDCAEEMRIWPHVFPGFFEWPLLERSYLVFIKNGIWQLGKKSCFSSHAKIHKILDRKVHLYDEGKNLLYSKLFVKFQWCVRAWQGL